MVWHQKLALKKILGAENSLKNIERVIDLSVRPERNLLRI